jgi:DNA polymerase III sliding clamp (beta) subunit (PCNA family)
MMVSELTDGNFSDCRAFILVDNNYKLNINTKLLADITDRVLGITAGTFQTINFDFIKRFV